LPGEFRAGTWGLKIFLNKLLSDSGIITWLDLGHETSVPIAHAIVFLSFFFFLVGLFVFCFVLVDFFIIILFLDAKRRQIENRQTNY
jgi:hypothetical protein